MRSSAKLSSKAQITVPSWAREALGIGPGARVWLRVEGDKLIIERLDANIEHLRGSLRGAFGDVEEYIHASRRDRFGGS